LLVGEEKWRSRTESKNLGEGGPKEGKERLRGGFHDNIGRAERVRKEQGEGEDV